MISTSTANTWGGCVLRAIGRARDASGRSAAGVDSRTRTRFRPTARARWLAAPIALLAAGAVVQPAAAADAPPSPSLSWTPCYRQWGPFECATAKVPLDYDLPHGETISIAMTRLPASDPARRIGSLFLNPGGPGGSGVDYVLGVGQALYSEEVRARFDLVGFDPRGIMRSSGLRCFGSPNQWGLASTAFAFPTTPDEEIERATADRYLDDACDKRGTQVGAHMSTANVARDLDVMRRAVGDDKLSYAGVSYGSYLGVTYANMFPDRVRAVVVDGVLDPVAWSTGAGDEAATLPFSTRLHSDAGAQATLDEFFRLCDAAGERCAFSGGAAARYAALAERARRQPLTLTFPDGTTGVLDYSNLVGLTLGAMYSSDIWAPLAQLLSDIETLSSPAAIAARLQSFVRRFGVLRYPNFPEGFPGVGCEDSDNPHSYAAWSAAGAHADEQSGYFGRIWTWSSSICAEWKLFDADRYMGPFTNQTANPVLVIGNQFDPATRYEGAVAVSKLMPRSALLTVHGWGHTSLFLSRCADAAITRYLVDGATPPAGTVCEQDVAPFEAPPTTAKAQRRLLALGHERTLSYPRSRPVSRRPAGLGWPAATQRDGAPAATEDALAPHVAVAPDGDALVAWSVFDSAAGQGHVRARRRTENGRLGPVIELADPAVDSFDARVAVDDRGSAVFTWGLVDAPSGRLQVQARTRSDRGALGAVLTVSDPAFDAFDANVAAGANGTAVLTWVSFDETAGRARAHARTLSARGVLGPVLDLADSDVDSFSVRAAVAADGRAVLTWVVFDPAVLRGRVQARTLSRTGALGSVVDVSDPARDAGAQTIAVDDAGNAVLDWLAFDATRHAALVQSRSLSRAGALGAIADVSDPADDAAGATVSAGTGGRAVLAWWVVRRAGAGVQVRTRSARGTLGPLRDVSDVADDGYEPDVAIDDDGNAVLTWLAFDRRGVRVQSRGAPARGPLGPIADVSPVAEDAFGATVGVDEDGNALLGWSAIDDDSYSVQGRARSARGGYGPLIDVSTAHGHQFDEQATTAQRRLP